MKRLSSILIFICLSYTSHAQDLKKRVMPGDYLSISLKDNTLIKGILKLNNETTIVVESKTLGVLTILKTQIQSLDILTLKEFRDKNKYQFDNPLPFKNYITETAIGLDAGEAFYQNILLGLHSFSYGVTNNFTISGGFETFTIFVGEAPLFFLSPKFTFSGDNDHLHFGIGGNLLLIPDGSNRSLAGSVYGLSTIGSNNNNITLGVGVVFAGSGLPNTPSFQLGGMFRLANKLMVVSDQIIIIDNNDTFILGTWTLRYIAPKVSIDIGAAAIYESAAIPVLGVGIKF